MFEAHCISRWIRGGAVREAVCASGDNGVRVWDRIGQATIERF
jgi:hypothetical protein